MTEAIKVNGGGIKCDNPMCDFSDMTVTTESYPEWLNRPCPSCGDNLLTQADFDAVNKVLEAAKQINQLAEALGISTTEDSTEQPVKMRFKFNGDGDPKISVE